MTRTFCSTNEIQATGVGANKTRVVHLKIPFDRRCYKKKNQDKRREVGGGGGGEPDILLKKTPVLV